VKSSVVAIRSAGDSAGLRLGVFEVPADQRSQRLEAVLGGRVDVGVDQRGDEHAFVDAELEG
jgi:hypothetical protein